MQAVIFVKRSERFPGKHVQLVDNKTIIDRVVSRLQKCEGIDETVIFSKDSAVKTDLCNVVEDKSDGSIADSLYAALKTFGDLFAFAGDMPCLSTELIDDIMNSWTGTSIVPFHSDGSIEPLHALYAGNTASVLKENIHRGEKSLRDYVRRIPHIVYFIPENRDYSFFNVNYPQDLIKVKKGC